MVSCFACFLQLLVTVGDWGCLLRIVDRYIVPLDRSTWPNPHLDDPSGQVSDWYPMVSQKQFPETAYFLADAL